MLTASRNGRSVAAMVLSRPVNGVRGIVQCAVPGCEAHAVLMHADGAPASLIDEFMMSHDCDPNRFARGRSAS